MVKAQKKEESSGIDKGWALLKKGDFEGALAVFEELLEQEESLEALYGRACSLFRNEEYEAALKELSNLIKSDPANHIYLHTRALVYGADERIKEAIRDMEKVVDLSPNLAEAWCDLGASYVLQKEYSKANDCFDKCIDLDKSCPNAWFGKGMVALEKKEYKRAIEFLNAAIKLDGKNLLSLMARAEAFIMSNKKAEAQKDISKLLSLEPGLFNNNDDPSHGVDDYNDNAGDDSLSPDDDYDAFKTDD